MSEMVLPQLSCPFPSRINHYVQAVHQHTREWSQRFGMIGSESSIRRFEAAKFAWLAARAYPTAPFEELCLVAEWNIWLFMHDDQCDETGFGRQPEQLSALYDRLRMILRGTTPYNTDSLFTHALYDLVQRLEANTTTSWRERFANSVDEYFAACVWEARNRAEQRVPDVATYIRMRPFTGALNTDIDLIEVCEHIHLPLDVQQNPLIQELTLICNNVVCWSNDIISLDKEIRSGDNHNLVIAVRAEQGCTWQEAVERVAEMHDAEVERFIELSKRVPTFGDILNAEIDRYIGVLKAWMRGNLDWAFDTGRYIPATRETT